MRIKLFDGLCVEVDGEDVTPLLPGLKGRTTVAYLAVNREAGVTRDELVEVLWPVMRPAAPRANLRSLLCRIRNVLGVGALIEGDRLRLADDVEVDLSRVIRRIVAAREARADGRAHDAIEAARGAVDILDGSMVRGIDGDWVDRLRATIDGHRNEMLSCIADMGSMIGGNFGNEAIAAARELVEHDGYLERSHAYLMKALARGGERAEALRVFESVRRQLDQELGALPGPELQELHQAILRGDDLGAERSVEGSAAWTSDHVPVPLEVAAATERVFVGRDQELARLAALGREHHGGGLIAVTGPPGVGKSLLTSRFAAQSAHSGHLVLFGRCDDGLGVAYQPFVEAIGRLARGLPADDIDRLFGRVARDLTRIVPDLGGSDAASPRDEPDTERYRLFDAVADVLRELAQATPVVLLLDDIHWSDRPTQQMLRHVARATRNCDVAILITHRDTPTDHADGFAELLEDLVRDGDLTAVPLAGLADDDIRKLVDAELNADAPPSVIAAIHARTGGNPLFARELARDLQAYLSSTGTLLADADLESWPVPDGIQHLVMRRRSLLGEADQELITRAATLGRKVCPTDLAAAADVAEVTAMAVLENATRAGLTQARASDPGTFSFTHPVMREAILAAISPPRLGRMHLENAQRLESLWWRTDEVEQHLARLAHHRLAAAEAGLEVATAIDWLDKAAAQLERTLAYEVSAALYTRALALLDGSLTQRGKRAGLLLRLSAAQWRSGRREDSRHARHAAFELASQLDDAELMAHASIGHERYFEINTFEADESAMARDALAALPDQAKGLRAQVLARLSRIDHWTGDPLRTSVVAEDAVKIAHDCGDDVVLAEAYNALLFAYREPSHPIPQRFDAAAELVAIGQRLGSDERRLEGEAHRLIALVEGGRTREIRPAVERFGRIVQGVRQPFWVYYRHAWAATLAFIEGDLKRSEHLHEVATQTAMGARSDAADGGAAATVQRMVEQGHAPLVADLAEQLATDGIHPGVWRSGVAMVTARAGRVDEASSTLRELVDGQGIRLKRDVLWGMAACLLADAAHGIGDRDAARVIMKDLKPIPGWIAMAGSGRGFLLVSQRLGQLAQVLGDHTQALAHFDRARQQGTDLSAGLIVAWADLETAATLLDRNGPGDRAKSAQLISAVTEFAKGRGLGLIEQRIAALRGDRQSGLAFAV